MRYGQEQQRMAARGPLKCRHLAECDRRCLAAGTTALLSATLLLDPWVLLCTVQTRWYMVLHAGRCHCSAVGATLLLSAMMLLQMPGDTASSDHTLKSLGTCSTHTATVTAATSGDATKLTRDKQLHQQLCSCHMFRRVLTSCGSHRVSTHLCVVQHILHHLLVCLHTQLVQRGVATCQLLERPTDMRLQQVCLCRGQGSG